MILAQLELNEATEMDFGIEVHGTTESTSEIRFIIEGPTYGIICKCVENNGTITATIPKLKGILPAGTFEAKLEVVVDGKFFVPLTESIEFKPMVEFDVTSTKTKPAAAPTVQTTGVKVRVIETPVTPGPVVEKPVEEAKGENRALWDRINARGTVPSIDRERYTDMSDQGLEGPFRTKSGKVLYYDAREGKYYDRDSDMYVDNKDYEAMNEAKAGHDEFRGASKDVPTERSRPPVRKPATKPQQEETPSWESIVKAQGAKPLTDESAPQSKRSKAEALRRKLEDMQGKLRETKKAMANKSLKEAPINQVVPTPGQPAQAQPGQPVQPGQQPAAQTQPQQPPAPPGSPMAAKASVPDMVTGLKSSMQPAAFNALKQTIAKA
jgi:hypothetical protein